MLRKVCRQCHDESALLAAGEPAVSLTATSLFPSQSYYHRYGGKCVSLPPLSGAQCSIDRAHERSCLRVSCDQTHIRQHEGNEQPNWPPLTQRAKDEHRKFVQKVKCVVNSKCGEFISARVSLCTKCRIATDALPRQSQVHRACGRSRAHGATTAV